MPPTPALPFIGITGVVSSASFQHELCVGLPVTLLKLPGVPPPRPVIFLFLRGLAAEHHQSLVIGERVGVNKRTYGLVNRLQDDLGEI